MRKGVFALIVLIIFIFFFLLLSSVKKETAGKECVVDSDCVKQQTTCCGCNMGGQEQCMSEANASYWKNKMAECKQDIVCIAMFNCRQIECKCINNKCTE